MTTAIVIFARMDSSRLPGKTLMSLAGVPMLTWTIERCEMVGPRLPVIVATSSRSLDDPIEAHAKGLGLPVFRGPADDVLGRALACAKAQGLDALVRVSGDSPFIAPDVIRGALERHDAEKGDLTTNVFPRGFPAGVSVEVIPSETLAKVAQAAQNPADREHVTRYCYGHPGVFRIVNVTAHDTGYDERLFTGRRLAVDTREDFERATWISDRLKDRTAPLDIVTRLARAWDEQKIKDKEQVS